MPPSSRPRVSTAGEHASEDGRSADGVAIIGASGALGFGLAIRLAGAGVPVAIGSREKGRSVDTVERARALVPEGVFSAHENGAAVRSAATVILSVPFPSHAETLTGLRSAFVPGQLVIDATVPLAAGIGGAATRMLGVWQGSAAQQTRELLGGGARVVSALHTVSAASLTDLAHPLEQDVLLCGDARADKQATAELIQLIEGLRCIDCGPLEMARTTESLTALMIAVKVRYTSHAGIRLTGLPRSLWE